VKKSQELIAKSMIKVGLTYRNLQSQYLPEKMKTRGLADALIRYPLLQSVRNKRLQKSLVDRYLRFLSRIQSAYTQRGYFYPPGVFEFTLPLLTFFRKCNRWSQRHLVKNKIVQSTIRHFHQIYKNRIATNEIIKKSTPIRSGNTYSFVRQYATSENYQVSGNTQSAKIIFNTLPNIQFRSSQDAPLKRGTLSPNEKVSAKTFYQSSKIVNLHTTGFFALQLPRKDIKSIYSFPRQETITNMKAFISQPHKNIIIQKSSSHFEKKSNRSESDNPEITKSRSNEVAFVYKKEIISGTESPSRTHQEVASANKPDVNTYVAGGGHGRLSSVAGQVSLPKPVGIAGSPESDNGGLRDHMDQLAEDVYLLIEKKLRTERERRGQFF
jgi:hypothetical protein